MDKAQVQKSSTTTVKQNTSLTKTRTSKTSSQQYSVFNNSSFQNLNSSNQLTPVHLLYLQRTLGNQAVGRIIQAKLTISEPDDPYEREADQVADKVMRMANPVTSGEEETKVQTKPLSSQITPLIHRMPEKMADEEYPPIQAKQEEGTERDEEAVVAKKSLIQRIARDEMPEDEQTVAPKLKSSADAPIQRRVDDEEESLQAKFEMDSNPQHDQEVKKQEIDQSGSFIHRQTEEDEAIQTKVLPGHSPQVSRISPIGVGSANRSIQRLCSGCAEEKHQEEGKPEMAQRKQARYQLHDDRDEEEQCVQPKGVRTPTPHVTPSIAVNVNALNHGGSPLPKETRAFFEPRFGVDLSQVRVHTGSQAAETAKSINARAFTVGNNIAFGGGQFAPESQDGRRLLAHELTHVVQQASSINRLSAHLQLQVTTDTPASPDQLIDQHTTLGFLDEEGLGKDLAGRLPGDTALTNGVLDKISNSDRDDVAYEITIASAGKLGGISEILRIRFVREMVYGVVTDQEEGAIATIWMSFEPKLPQVAERNRELWKKSLWESDQLDDYLKPIGNLFATDVTGVARAYLTENRQALFTEARRYGIDLENKKSVVETHPDYLQSVRAIAPGVLKLKKQLDELKEIKVGYTSVKDELGYIDDVSVTFNPERMPQKPPNKTESPPWPTWEEVKIQYDRVSAIISAFANIYPTIYLLIQQDKLEALEQGGDASKAQQVILETLQKTEEKIQEADGKIVSGKITHFDLKMIQTQLLSGTSKAAYTPKYLWNQPFYQDIANDDIKGHDAYEFWTDLGLSLAVAAALIAAPFTGGATAAFLVGFGVGIGAAQAGKSWDQYLKTSTLGDANVKDELGLVAKGEVSAALVNATIQTVAVFLDIFGARAATTGAKVTREALEVAEKGLKEQMMEEARKRLLRGALKEGGLTAAGAGLAIGMHELEEDEPVPDLEATAGQWQVDLGPEQLDTTPAPVNRMVIQRVPGPGATIPATAAKQPILLTGGEFEIHVEKALLKGPMGDLPQMSFVIPGQYTGSGWGIDRIGIVFDDATGMVDVYHLEMKFVSPNSPFTPELGKPGVGTQTGKAWTQKAVDGFLNSQHPKARAGKERLRRALQKMHPGETIDIERMRSFLNGKLVGAPVRVIIPHWADFAKIYKQVAALIRAGRDIKLLKVFK